MAEHQRVHGGARSPGHDAQHWDRRYADTDRLWSAEPNATVEEIVGQLPPGRALDLGAGEGRHAVWLAQRGWRVTAVDFSEVGIERGRAHARGAAVDWVVHDVRRWRPPTASSYDLVLLAYLHLDTTWSTAAGPGSHPVDAWWWSATHCAISPTASAARRIRGCCTP
ncbi:MAG: methyltransferase domain-containing protein, partial [Actinomycetota bacterium]|nr:methyltransferase domain-containing protein [Actinomycetota bacterium]